MNPDGPTETDTSESSIHILAPIFDLLLVFLYVVFAILVLVIPVRLIAPLAVVGFLPLVLIIPGYVLLAAVFPRRVTHQESEPGGVTGEHGRAEGGGAEPDGVTDDESGVGEGVTRVVMSIGITVLVVPLIGFVLSVSPLPSDQDATLLAIAAVSALLAGTAVLRRLKVPQSKRYVPTVSTSLEWRTVDVVGSGSRRERAASVLLLCSLVLAMGAVGYASVVPPADTSSSSFYVLNDSDDSGIAAGYPTTLGPGESGTVGIGIDNHEGDPTRYTVVVQMADADVSGNETSIDRQWEAERWTTPLVSDNSTYRRDHSFVAPDGVDTLRLQYLLYRGDAPATPDRESAYRYTRLWVDIEQ